MNDKKYYVYSHTRLDKDEVFYIGISSIRYRSKSKHNRNKYWNNITNKTEYKIDIIYENLSKKEACKLEKELILKYGRKDLNEGVLCNMTEGGDGTSSYIKTTEEKLKHASILSKKYKGEGNPFYNKNHTPETKLYISNIQKQDFTYNEGSWNNVNTKKYNDGNNNQKSKKVINIRTGIIFKCLREASEYYNIKYSTMKCRMLGDRKYRNELKYLEK